MQILKSVIKPLLKSTLLLGIFLYFSAATFGQNQKTPQLGSLIWMTENLSTTTCEDGTPIDPANYKKEGDQVLYNTFALEACNVCPSGWRVPTKADIESLATTGKTYDEIATILNLSRESLAPSEYFRIEGYKVYYKDIKGFLERGTSFLTTKGGVDNFHPVRCVKAGSSGQLIGHWQFTGETPLKDLTGNFDDLSLKGASLDDDGLAVGKDAFAQGFGSLSAPVKAKTLIAVAKIDDINVRSGSILTLDHTDKDVFDGIVYAEKNPQEWMAGSNRFARTKNFVYPPEMKVENPNEWVIMAITYGEEDGMGKIKLYWANSLMGEYQSGSLPAYQNNLEVLFGIRHTLNDRPIGFLNAHIKEAWIYDNALTEEEMEGMGYEAPLYDKMIAGNRLEKGQMLVSADGSVTLKMQYNGNLVMYKDSKKIWDAKTTYKGHHVVLQSDGNLVIYGANNEAPWSSKTHPYFDSKYRNRNNKPVELNLMNNGSMKLINSTGNTMWSVPEGVDQIEIVSAEYGIPGGTTRDVKTIIQNMVNEGATSIEIINQQIIYDHGLADPAPGRQKTLTITYTKGGETITKEVRERNTLEF